MSDSAAETMTPTTTVAAPVAAPVPELSILIPMYNEEEAIGATLEGLLQTFGAAGAPLTEILVIDDGSTDGSAARVAAVTDPAVRLLRHPYNIGNGAAIKNGIRHARGRYVLMMDADGQHRVEDVNRLLAHREVYDMVVGARTSQSDTDMHRNVANRIYNLFASYVCGRPIEDLTSGFRLIRREVAQSFVYLLPNTFSYPSTITLAVIRAGHSLHYIPITVRRRLGKSKINLVRDGVRFLTIILRIAVFFSPLKVFVPLSLAFFGTGMGWYLFRVFIQHRAFPPVSSLLLITAVLIFLMGLLSEQITYLRYERR